MTPVLNGLLFDRAWICTSAGAAVAAVSVAALALMVGWVLRGRSAPLRYGLLLAALVVLGIVPAVAAASRLAGWGAVRVSPVTVDRPLAPRPFLVASAMPRPTPVPASEAGEDALRPEGVADPDVVPMRVPTFREAASGLLWVWLGGFVFFAGLVIRDLLRLRRLRQSLVPCSSESAVGLLREAARSVGLTQPPRLFESAAVPVPVVIGPAKPVVVLPAGMATSLERQKLSAVLLHEAAHVVHGDLWVGLLQHAVAAVFWWCPPVHRLNRRLADVREEICDDYVVAAQGDGFQLAEVLVEMAAGLREKRQRLAIGTLGVIDEKPALEGRVERLVDLAGRAIPMTRMNRMAVAAAGAFGAVALAIVVATTIHAADELTATQPRAMTTGKEVIAAETDGVFHAASECRESLKALGGISMHITGTVEVTNEIDALGAMAGVRVSEVVRCQNRERVSTYFDQQGSSQQEQFRNEYIVDEDGAVLAIQAMFDRQGRQRPVTRLSDLSVMLADQRLVKRGTTVRNRGDVYFALQESGAAIGWVGRAHLADYIQGEVKAEGSGDATLIASQGPLGDVEMSLSQTHGYLPNSIRIRKRADSLYGGERVATAFSVWKPPPSTVVPPDTEASPSGAVRSMEWRINVDAYERTPNGVWYPAQIALVQTHLFDDGRKNVTKSRLSVVGDDRAPDACGPQTRIPKGYAVYVEKASQLPYRWSGSDPEPGVPATCSP